MVSKHSIGDSEDLGRCCFDSQDAGRDRPRTRFIKRSFDGQGLMSVDNLGNADLRILTRLHDSEGTTRKPPRTFHGWYVFNAGVVRTAGWDVCPDRTDENPWHAQVRRLNASEQEDAFDQSCLTIATGSRWQARPMSREDEAFLDEVTRPLR